jgi:hypothetical protein
MSLLKKSIFLSLTICYIIFCGAKNNAVQIFFDNVIDNKKALVVTDEPILVSDNSIDLFELSENDRIQCNVEKEGFEISLQRKFNFGGLFTLIDFFSHNTPPPEKNRLL